MSSAALAHLLQLGRPDASPRPPATAEAATLPHPTSPLSQGAQQDRWPVVNTGTDCVPGLLLDGSVDRVNAC